MTELKRSEPAVRMEPDRLVVNGRSEILLCASLFYFRIPRQCWRLRMEQLREMGYNAIDVYFPWNYHEREEGVWDFEGERDAAEFLRLAAEAGLWVVARPGPYICSEWDGGALPAYLIGKDGLTLRDHDPAFLAHVARWFERILPLLRRFELGRGGSVVAVQLENELDFYRCGDPRGYMSALRDMAVGHGIGVPLIACAGQGGLFGASGDVDGVVPTCNFYPDNRNPDFEEIVLAYKRELERRGGPLLVTETNRSHFLLRRLLSCGVKLLGPYLQVSGTDYGFTNAVNNWGKPLAFMTSDYDFGGMISPEGHLRPEAYEGKLLRRLLNVYGAALAEAVPEGPAPKDEQPFWRDRGYDVGPYRLALAGGGRLIFVADTVRETCLALPEGITLDRWGIAGEIAGATAELSDVYRQEAGGCGLVFHFDEGKDGRIDLKFAAEPAAVRAEAAAVRTDGPAVSIRFAGRSRGKCLLEWEDGRSLTVHGLSRSDALLLEGVEADGSLTFGTMPVYADREIRLEGGWTAAWTEGHEPLPAAAGAPAAGTGSLEARGIYRGFAWYEYEAGGAAVRDSAPRAGAGAGSNLSPGARPGGSGHPDEAPEREPVPQREEEPNREPVAQREEDAAGSFAAARPAIGLLAASGSDVVSVYADGEYVGTVVPGGSSRYLERSFGSGKAPAKLTARVEIWGHSNFDDPRLPSLRLNARKGLADLIVVTDKRDLTGNWRYFRTANPSPDPQRIAPETDDERWPLTGFGGWHPNEPLAYEYYRRTVRLSPGTDRAALWLDGLESRVQVWVDGREAGTVTPDDPWLLLRRTAGQGDRVQLTLMLERRIGAAAGKVTLLEGRAAELCRLSAAEEPELAASADLARPGAEAIRLPCSLAPGRTAWLYASPEMSAEAGSGAGRGVRLRAGGANVKLTALAGDRVVGRMWLPGGAERPTMSGGRPDSVFFPASWLAGGRQLRVFAEAVVPGEPGQLNELKLVFV